MVFMNERIKELAIEAEQWCYANLAMPTPAEWNDRLNRKFAELIVKECMEQVWYTREDGINGNISEVIKERMATHFGVK